MSRQFRLMVQRPKLKDCGLGFLSVGKDGEAQFFDSDASDGKVIAEMHRARIEFAAANGIMLSGMEPTGVDRAGMRKYVFQEWWLVYTHEAPSVVS